MEHVSCLPHRYTIILLTGVAEYTHKMFPTSEFVVDTIHIDNDTGQQANVFNLTPAELKERRVICLDLGRDGIDAYTPGHRNPAKVRSEKTGRGPLTGNWARTDRDYPVMCAYKLLRMKLDSYLLWPASGYMCNVPVDRP